MPTYEYACTECGDRTEVVQPMADAPLTTCTVCGGRLRKVFSPVGIVFKGSGFYRTDSRGKADKAGKADGGDKAAEQPADTTTSTASSSDGGASAAEAGKPAKPKAAEKSA